MIRFLEKSLFSSLSGIGKFCLFKLLFLFHYNFPFCTPISLRWNDECPYNRPVPHPNYLSSLVLSVGCTSFFSRFLPELPPLTPPKFLSS